VKNNNVIDDKFNFFNALLDAVNLHNRTKINTPDLFKNFIVVDDYFFNKVGSTATVEKLEFVKLSDVDENLHKFKERGVVLVCIEHAQDSLKLIKFFTDNNVKYIPIGGANTGGYVYDDRVCRETIESSFISQNFQGFAKFSDPGSAQDFVNLCQALFYTNHLVGDVVEVGCFNGSSGSLMLDYSSAKKLKSKRFWFFDVFTGFDYPEAFASSDAIWANTHQSEGMKIVEDRLKSRAGQNTVIVQTSNIITDELPAQLTKVAVANIDVDLYEAVKVALFKIGPLITAGGIMICEDAGHTPGLFGARLALEEFLDSDIGRSFTCVHQTSGQVFLIRHS